MNTDSTEPPESANPFPEDSTDGQTALGQREAGRVLRLLDDAIVSSRRSRRRIERDLGWSQGYLGSLLRGRIGLKVWHVFALSHVLGVEPLSLFLSAAPPRDPSWIFEQLGLPMPQEESEDTEPEEPAEPPLTRGDVENLARKLLHEELARFGLQPRPESEYQPPPVSPHSR
jgi:hypothetical protein